jgi:hypothetical protein
MIVAWYLLYGPKYIYHVHVVDPSVIMKQRQKDLTFLDLPPDALKQVKPKPTPAISDKDRVAADAAPHARQEDPRGTGGDASRGAAGSGSAAEPATRSARTVGAATPGSGR